MHVLRTWMPLLGLWHTSKRNSSQKCWKWSSDFMVVAMVSNTCPGVFWCSMVMVSIVQECLEGLLVFTFKHHFELFPASLGITGLICIDVEGFQVVESPGVEGLHVLNLLGQWEAELRCLPMWGVRSGCHYETRVDRDCLEKTMDCLRSTGAFGVLIGDLFRTLR